MRILFLLVLAFFLFSLKEKDTSEVIVWNENKPLTWDDFKGKPARRFAAASTNYDIVKSCEQKNDSIAIDIKAVFYTYKSWKKTSWLNDDILAHEQKHFDIVELFARKLREKVLNEHYTSYQDLLVKVDTLYNQNDKAMDIYQDKYDDETDGSMNGDMQRKWNKDIMAEINKW